MAFTPYTGPGLGVMSFNTPIVEGVLIGPMSRFRQRRPRTLIGAPVVLTPISVQQQQRTIQVVLAASRSRAVRRARRATDERFYSTAFYLSPLAVPGTPGQRVTRALYLRAAIRRRIEESRHAPKSLYTTAPYLSPAAVPGTPGEVTTRTILLTLAQRRRLEESRRAPHSRIRAPKVIQGSSLPVFDGVTSGTTGASTPAAIAHPAPVRVISPPWRFIVAYLDPNSLTRRGASLALLDRLATARTLTYELDTPAQAQGTVDSDNPNVWLTTDSSAGYDGQPYLAEGNRLLYAFRREGAYDADTGLYAPWVIRFAGIIMQINDVPSGDQPKSTFTAFDPWLYLYNRPVVDSAGNLPGRDGISSTKTGTGTYDFPTKKAGDLILTLLKRTIHYHGNVWIDAGTPYGGTIYYGSSGASLGDTPQIDITFSAGMTVGEAWKQICDTSAVDIALRPVYDPLHRPGYLAELAIHRTLGQERPGAIMAWDLPPRSLLSLDRLEDGSQRVNIAQFLTQGGVPVQPPAIDGVAPLTEPGQPSQHWFGEYWGTQTQTGQAQVNATTGIIWALMNEEVKVRKWRSTTIRLDPAPARAPIPLSEYNLGDQVPIYASKRLRRQIPDPTLSGFVVPTGRIYKIPIVLTDDSVETVQQMEFSADQLENVDP
jgi:hypothetical protein